MANRQAIMETTKGRITIELYEDKAPITAGNFIDLVGQQFYDGLSFHRIEPGFVIQGGDPRGNGTGGPEYTLRPELSDTLKHVMGTVAMARTDDPDSAGSQFYVTLAPAPHLDGSYTIFGEVVDGKETVEKIGTNPQGRPVVKKATLVPRANAADKAKPAATKKEGGS